IGLESIVYQCLANDLFGNGIRYIIYRSILMLLKEAVYRIVIRRKECPIACLIESLHVAGLLDQTTELGKPTFLFQTGVYRRLQIVRSAVIVVESLFPTAQAKNRKQPQ